MKMRDVDDIFSVRQEPATQENYINSVDSLELTTYLFAFLSQKQLHKHNLLNQICILDLAMIYPIPYFPPNPYVQLISGYWRPVYNLTVPGHKLVCNGNLEL